MRPHLALALPLLLALAAGCLGDHAAEQAADLPAADADRLGTAPGAEPTSQTTDFGWAAAVGVPTAGQDVEFMASNGDGRELGQGVRMLTANVTWTCGAAVCDLHAYLCAPGEAEGPLDRCALHAMGPSPLALVAADPEAGEWVVHLSSDGPVVDVSGTITMAES